MTAPDQDSLRGRLLVATPGLLDPNFVRAVVLIVEHNDEGAAGIVLNRPSESTLAEGPLGAWNPVAADPPFVFVGGPVEPASPVCLARPRSDRRPDGWQQVMDGLGVLDLGCDPHVTSDAVDRLRVFVGYAGWGAGQLEGEIDVGSWYVLDADPQDALCTEPSRLWGFVLRRQGGRLALVSSFPTDPTMN